MNDFIIKENQNINSMYSIKATFSIKNIKQTKIIFTNNNLSHVNDVLWNILDDKDLSMVDMTEEEYNKLENISIIKDIPIYSFLLEKY